LFSVPITLSLAEASRNPD